MADIFDGSEDKGNQTGDDKSSVNYLDVAKDKFKTESGDLDVEGLARGKYESDSHINNLETELHQLRGDLKSQTNMEQNMLSFLDKVGVDNASSGDNQSHESQSQESVKIGGGITREEVVELLLNDRNETQESFKRDKNKDLAISAMRSNWGNNYRKTLEGKAVELGVDSKFLNNLAAEQPTAFIKLVGADVKREASDSHRTEAPHSTTNIGKTNLDGTRHGYAYYQQMRKSNPTQYHSVAVQKEMHRLQGEAMSRGEDFSKT